MINIGQFNTLKVIKEVAFGVYLQGGHYGDILLPKKVVPAETKIGDSIDVFIYTDSEDKIIATTARPRAVCNSCAYLKVIDVNRVGAFLDWGLDKDLLVPVPEQFKPMEKDKFYLVYVKLDNKGRIIASSKLDHSLDKTPAEYEKGDEVDLIVADSTHLGTKVVINNSHWGLIHTADIFQNIGYGKRVKGYIKTLRDDGKIDVVLRKIGHEGVSELAERILADLKKNEGFLALHDKSPPEAIQRAFGESKKSFKNAIGQLYKRGDIKIEPEGIRLKRSI